MSWADWIIAAGFLFFFLVMLGVPIYENKKLLILIAKKVGISEEEIKKATGE